MNSKQNILTAGVIGLAALAFAFFTLGPRIGAQPSPQTNPFMSGQVVVQSSPLTNVTPTYQGQVWTNWLSGSSAFENDTPIDTYPAKDVALQFRFRCSAANSGAITVALGRSNDRSAGTTNIELFTAFAATANGTATVTVNTNLSSANGLWGAYRYLYVMYITNAGATSQGLTNYSITAVLK